MRSESANRFADAPADVPFRVCPYGHVPRPEIIQVEEGRRVTAVDWVPGTGGVAMIADEGRTSDQKELVFVTESGSVQQLPLPAGLSSPVYGVNLVAGHEPLVVIGEARWSDSDIKLTVMEELFDVPDEGDLIVMDFGGVVRARHRSAHGASLSPDFRWMSYWRSGDNGLHNLFVTRPEQESAVFVAAIVEMDPGSGMSFSECWSADSRYLHVSGEAFGLRTVRWTYDVIAQELYADDGGTAAAMSVPSV